MAQQSRSPPCPRANSLAIVRCADYGEAEARQVAALRSYFRDDIVLALHDKAGSRRTTLSLPPELKVVWLDENQIVSLGLLPVPDWPWRCGDYAQFAVAHEYPAYDGYWMVEPDVRFNFEDLPGFFSELDSNPSDMLASQLSPRDEQWAHWPSIHCMFPEVWGCFYGFTRLSTRAIAHALAARKRYQEQNPAPEHVDEHTNVWANDESLVCSALHSGGFVLTALEDLMPERFPPDGHSFTFHRLMLDEHLANEGPYVLHPVVPRDEFFPKLQSRLGPAAIPYLDYYAELLQAVGSEDERRWFAERVGQLLEQAPVSENAPRDDQAPSA